MQLHVKCLSNFFLSTKSIFERSKDIKKTGLDDGNLERFEKIAKKTTINKQKHYDREKKLLKNFVS